MADTLPRLNEPFSLDMPFDEAMQRFARVNTKDLQEPVQQGAKATPFVKWVGGKRGIINKIKPRVPKEFNRYFEPFIGGGALFFEIRDRFKKGIILDQNVDLALAYKTVRDNVEELITALRSHAINHNSDYYYQIRSQHELTDPIAVSARLIYLNKTCFNGLYRVNSSGEFNVPIGKYTNPAIVQEDNLRACSKVLQGVEIKVGDFTLIKPEKDDFVYFDPPYHPVSDTSNFTNYTSSDFNEEDQKRLHDFIVELHGKGVKIMLSNSNTPFIRKLYKDNFFKVGIVNAPRVVNCKPNKRNSVEEVLITSY